MYALGQVKAKLYL